MSTAPARKARGSSFPWAFAGVILLILYFTNPGYHKHMGHVTSYPATVSRFDFPAASNYEYHSYFLFSTTTDGGATKTFGILGMVF